MKPDNILIGPRLIANAAVLPPHFETMEHLKRQIFAADEEHSYHKIPWNATQLFMIDFGQAQKYLDPDGKHRLNEKKVFELNPLLASKNVLEDNTWSRRDDIIQIVYNLVYLLKGSWTSKFKTRQGMKEFKQKATPEDICLGGPSSCILRLC